MPGRPGPLDRPAAAGAQPAPPARDRDPGQFALGAVVLAGGRASRLGGADKPGLAVGGRSLAAAAVTAAAQAGADHLILVGPDRPEIRDLLAREGRASDQGQGRRAPGEREPETSRAVIVEFTREQPPGAGPVPALAAGLTVIHAPWVFLLAADLPFLRSWQLRQLRDVATAAAALRTGTEGVAGAVLVDDEGRPQWLTSCWQTAALRTALAAYSGRSLGGLLGAMSPAMVPLDRGSLHEDEAWAPPWLDCDTPEDLARARQLVQRHRKGHDEHP